MEYFFVEDAPQTEGRIKNVIRVKNGIHAHFQIEQKNGLTFMRFKRRRLSQ